MKPVFVVSFIAGFPTVSLGAAGYNIHNYPDNENSPRSTHTEYFIMRSGIKFIWSHFQSYSPQMMKGSFYSQRMSNYPLHQSSFPCCHCLRSSVDRNIFLSSPTSSLIVTQRISTNSVTVAISAAPPRFGRMYNKTAVNSLLIFKLQPSQLLFPVKKKKKSNFHYNNPCVEGR